MKTQELKYVTRRRAAVLLGLSELELSRISSESGLGHKEIAGEQEETYFTYEELADLHAGRTPGELDKNEFPPAPLSSTPTPGRSPQRSGVSLCTRDLAEARSRSLSRFRNPLTDRVGTKRLSANRNG